MPSGSRPERFSPSLKPIQALPTDNDSLQIPCSIRTTDLQSCTSGKAGGLPSWERFKAAPPCGRKDNHGDTEKDPTQRSVTGMLRSQAAHHSRHGCSNRVHRAGHPSLPCVVPSRCALGTKKGLPPLTLLRQPLFGFAGSAALPQIQTALALLRVSVPPWFSFLFPNCHTLEIPRHNRVVPYSTHPLHTSSITLRTS